MKLEKTTQYPLLWLIFKLRDLQECQSLHNDIAPAAMATTRRKQISIRIFSSTKLNIYCGWATVWGTNLYHYQTCVQILNKKAKAHTKYTLVCDISQLQIIRYSYYPYGYVFCFVELSITKTKISFKKFMKSKYPIYWDPLVLSGLTLCGQSWATASSTPCCWRSFVQRQIVLFA